MTINLETLYAAAWPEIELGTALKALSVKVGFSHSTAQIPRFPDDLDVSDDENLMRWLSFAGGGLGLETSHVSASYCNIEKALRLAGPGLVLLPKTSDQTRFLALIKGNRRRISVLTPQKKVLHIYGSDVSDVLKQDLETPFVSSIKRFMDEADIQGELKETVKKTMLRDQLHDRRITGLYLIRLAPETPFFKQLIRSSLPGRIIVFFTSYAISQLLLILSWAAMGRCFFTGHFETVWMSAWALLTFAGIPFQLVVSWAQGIFAVEAGGIFKQRLVSGILHLKQDDISIRGAGGYLGRVIESEAIESASIDGGIMTILAVFDLILAVLIMTLGTYGRIPATLFVVWILLTVLLGLRSYASTRQWVISGRDMVNHLVERMVAHRTRLVQQNRDHLHHREDEELAQYHHNSKTMDQIGILFNAFTSRSWILAALIALSVALMIKPVSTLGIAITVGGILYGAQALGTISDGFLSLTLIAVAWDQIKDISKAAQKRTDTQEKPFYQLQRIDHERFKKMPLLAATDLGFSYRHDNTMQILKKCDINWYLGDKIRIEGPPGSGKSTMAKILAGQCDSQSGALTYMGLSIKKLGHDDWRKRIVTVSEYACSQVMSNTLAFNLLMGRCRPHTADDLAQAAAICREIGLEKLIERMPSGMYEMVGDHGWRLSHGEQSRLFIARAVLQQPDILILDRSFTALDPENLYRTMDCVLKRAQTVIIIGSL